MSMLIDQVGRSAGVAGFARLDLLANAAVITLTDTTAGGSTLFQILYHPPADLVSVSSLQASVGNSHVWTFHATATVEGPWRVRLLHTNPNGTVTEEIRILGLSVSGTAAIPPAPNERADPTATDLNKTDPAVIARSERNAPTASYPAGNPYGWADAVGASGGGGTITSVVAGTGLTGGGASGAVTLAADFGSVAGKVTQGDDPRLFDARVASALKTTGASVDVAAAAPGVAGNVLTLTDATHATWQAAAGGASNNTPLWMPPASPHANDVEFLSTVAPAGWEMWDNTDSVVITPTAGVDPYTPFTTTHVVKADYHTNFRNSYAAWQPTVEGGGHHITFAKSVTVPTNCWIMARLGFFTRYVTGLAADMSFGIMFAGDSGGHAQYLQNSMTFYLNGGGSGAMKLLQGKLDAGSFAGTVFGPSVDGGVGTPYEYLLLHKIGTVYHAWAIRENGQKQYWGSISHTATMSWVGFYMRSHDTTFPANPYYVADFFRQKDTATALPT